VAESLKVRAYDHVYQKLIQGDLVPGSRLSSRALATEIGISVIPVREAVSQLQSEGFVEHRSGIGSFVPAPSFEELLEIYELREVNESHAAAKASQSIHDTELAELQACVDQAAGLIERLELAGRSKRDPEILVQWTSMDARFHDTIMRAAGNRRAAEFVRRLRTMSRIFGQRVAFQPLQKFQQAATAHREIFAAIEQGDSEGARSRMSQHIQSAWQSLMQFHRRDRMQENVRG
jgi:DNA-binding GntR family transcriptional regulator